MLRVTLVIAEFPKADEGWLGKKIVPGTGHEAPIRFLSAMDSPVEVLLVQGMLIGLDGRVLRVGAEGILAQDSRFLVQMAGAREEIRDPVLGVVLTHVRREDLPGRPPSWEVALDELVEGLTAAADRR